MTTINTHPKNNILNRPHCKLLHKFKFLPAFNAVMPLVRNRFLVRIILYLTDISESCKNNSNNNC